MGEGQGGVGAEVGEEGVVGVGEGGGLHAEGLREVEQGGGGVGVGWEVVPGVGEGGEEGGGEGGEGVGGEDWWEGVQVVRVDCCEGG